MRAVESTQSLNRLNRKSGAVGCAAKLPRPEGRRFQSLELDDSAEP